MKLEIDGLTKQFGLHAGLSSLSCKISHFQMLVLIGPSGGGKSTLLRILAGLEYPSCGSVTVDNLKIEFTEEWLIPYRRTIGVVFQSCNLFPHLSALENVILPLHLVHNKTYEEARQISLDLLNRFDLQRHAGKKPFALSGGQLQRVALVRAIAPEPKLLILDEPTSALDPFMANEVLDLILELKNGKTAIIMATHQLRFAEKIADQIFFIANGKLLEQGDSKKMFDNSRSNLVKQYMSKV